MVRVGFRLKDNVRVIVSCYAEPQGLGGVRLGLGLGLGLGVHHSFDPTAMDELPFMVIALHTCVSAHSINLQTLKVRHDSFVLVGSWMGGSALCTPKGRGWGWGWDGDGGVGTMYTDGITMVVCMCQGSALCTPKGRCMPKTVEHASPY